eukprot:CAMPEP_0116045968 /NCGR_PEP_ID=MMETSP0321-20121206/27950_1 /TAXON_ID=163516 /ORGANISM="Leptocylindrus danicus var. danicus, Strain B650" /LENGTH=478 /DNA_ID=CAMNT_0003527435 /DNA_START=219 /DNA_END=1655 /DNA_ORIENTATION=+
MKGSETGMKHSPTKQQSEASTAAGDHSSSAKSKRNSGGVTERSKALIDGLRDLYSNKIFPIERKSHFAAFHPNGGEIREAEWEARPQVLLIGQYSTGKTSFIKHLLGGRDFPGMHIGPEPTTDKFIAVVHGCEDGAESGRIIKGNSLTVVPELPFAGLGEFGTAFLNKFEASVTPSPLLKRVTLIDTPGVLSGEKQRLARAYDFSEVARWFADRSDLILLLFDAHKLDISDELKEIIEKIRPYNDDKVRCVLNKADGVGREQLVRVYGSLLWSMGKIFQTPEVARVYCGSFWDQPLLHEDFKDMFERDEELLIEELMNLPASAAARKVNEVVKRIRAIKVHLCILGHLKRQMPLLFGREKTQMNLIKNLPSVLKEVKTIYDLSDGDMPNVNVLASKLRASNFQSFPTLDSKIIYELNAMTEHDIPELMRGVGGVSDYKLSDGSNSKSDGQNATVMMQQTLKDKLVSDSLCYDFASILL